MHSVIVIDDEFFTRKALIKSPYWEKEGFFIAGEADNGKNGYDLILKKTPDLAVVDINMPEMDGLTMVQKLREKGYMTKVIILTGYNDFTYAQQAIRCGITDYLLKPVQETELLKSLHRVKDELEYGVIREDQEPSIIRDKKDYLIEHIKEYIDKNYNDSELSIEKICTALAYNYHYIGKVFREREGITLGKFIIQYRMIQAKRMIEKGQCNMEELAESLGYDDTLYFMKCFKKYYECTPTQYIKREKGKKISNE